MREFSAGEQDIISVPVDYYDKHSKVDSLKKKLIPYVEKDLNYAWEEELRFIAFPKNYSAPYLYLNIGSLKDIAETVCIKPKEKVEYIIQQYIPDSVYKNGMYINT